MIKSLKQIQESINKNQILFIDTIISDIWKKDPMDYGIEIYDNDFIELSDFFIPYSDFINVAKYQIPEDIFYEYFDDTHLNFESDRIKEFKKNYTDCKDCHLNLVMFYRYCMKDDKEFIKQEKESLKESERKVKEAKEDFEKLLKDS